MIALLSGEVAAVGVTSVVLDVSGVGFAVVCPPSTAAVLTVGETATLHTQLVVREDSLTLYGFATQPEREEFLIVQSATGIGPKIALAMVATLSPGELKQAVLTENLVALSAVPGVGRKVAGRLVLELKDKVQGLSDGGGAPVANVGRAAAYQEQVIDGLQGLGYSAHDAQVAWEAVADLARDEAVSVSRLMRDALRSLARP